MLSLKHPEAQQSQHEMMFQAKKNQVWSTVYEDIDKDLIQKAAMKTKGECVPLDLAQMNCAESWFPIISIQVT